MEDGQTSPPAPPDRWLTVEVTPIANLDLGTVELLAALQVAARRRGWRLQLANATPQLRELLWLAGLEVLLDATVPNGAPPSAVPTGGQGVGTDQGGRLLVGAHTTLVCAPGPSTQRRQQRPRCGNW